MLNIILIGTALGFDAFGVALGLGCGNKLVRKQKLGLIFSFGFFQFLLTISGAFVGNYINTNFFQISNLLSGIVILFIGFIWNSVFDMLQLYCFSASLMLNNSCSLLTDIFSL